MIPRPLIGPALAVHRLCAALGWIQDGRYDHAATLLADAELLVDLAFMPCASAPAPPDCVGGPCALDRYARSTCYAESM